MEEYIKAYRSVASKTHTLNDLLNKRVLVIVEGDSGRDTIRARQLGLFTCNVKGIDVIAWCEADAAPLIHYIEQGGTYGSLDFSRLLGYSNAEIEEYAKMLKMQAKLSLPKFSPGLQGSTPTALVIGDSHVDSSGLAAPLRDGLKSLGYTVTMAGVGATAAATWTDKNPVCRPKKDKCVDKDTLPKGIDLLVVSLGTNDAANASAANADKSKEASKTVSKILQLKDFFGAKNMFWIGPPAMADTMNHYTNENMEYIYKAASAAGVPVFDSRPLTQKLRETKGDQDAVHFYGKKGKAWADAVLAGMGKTTQHTATSKPKIVIAGGISVAVIVALVIWLKLRNKSA